MPKKRVTIKRQVIRIKTPKGFFLKDENADIVGAKLKSGMVKVGVFFTKFKTSKAPKFRKRRKKR